MGNMHAMEWANIGGDMALLAHLQGNHYPPIPTSMLVIAKETIQRLANDEDPTHVVTLTDGINWKGCPTAPLWAVYEHMHLDAFVYAEKERRIEANRLADLVGAAKAEAEGIAAWRKHILGTWAECPDGVTSMCLRCRSHVVITFYDLSSDTPRCDMHGRVLAATCTREWRKVEDRVAG